MNLECTYLVRVLVLQGEIERFLDCVPEHATGARFRSVANSFLDCLKKVENDLTFPCDCDNLPF